MSKLEPLQRYHGFYEDENRSGSYVLYAAAQAREKVLVEALRDIAAGTYSHDSCVRGRAILAQIDAEKEATDVK